MQPMLAPLPALALAEDAEFENNFLEPVSVLEDLAGSAPAVPVHHTPGSNGAAAGPKAQIRKAKPPCPVDLTLPPQAAVVMATGGTAIAGAQSCCCCAGKSRIALLFSCRHGPLNSCSCATSCDPPVVVWPSIFKTVRLHATGPNTGGKTASLKALGLAVLMAKAGLFLPVADGQAPPQLLWFDKVCIACAPRR